MLDGELCCLQILDGGRVRCRFDHMSAFMVARPPHRPAHALTATLVVFDVLAADGKDLRRKPWLKRRRKLDRLLAGATGQSARRRSSTPPTRPRTGC